MSNNELIDLRLKVTEQIRQLGAPNELLAHLRQVADLSMRIAQTIVENGFLVELRDVLVGALLHDVGYLREKGIRHGIVGGEIAKELGYSERVARIIETHIVGGISKEIIIASGLDLPQRDYVPTSIEEKIVAFSDQLVHLRSKSGIFLKEDPSRDPQVILNIYQLYEDVLGYCFLSGEK